MSKFRPPGDPTHFCRKCKRDLWWAPPWTWTPEEGRLEHEGPLQWLGPSGDVNCYLSEDEKTGYPHDPEPLLFSKVER